MQSPRGFVAAVQDAMNLEGLQGVPPPSQNCLDGPDNSSTQDRTDSQKDNQSLPLNTVASHAPLSSDGLLCTMHAKSLCSETDLNGRSTNGLWFQRMPTLPLTTATPVISVTPGGGDISVYSTERAVNKDTSYVFELVDTIGQKHAKGRVASTLKDNNHDDVISRTTHKSDGR